MSVEEFRKLFPEYEEHYADSDGGLTLKNGETFVHFYPPHTAGNNPKIFKGYGYSISGEKNIFSIDRDAYDEYKKTHKN